MRAILLCLLIGGASVGPAQGPATEDGCQANAASRSLCAAEARLTDGLRRNDAAALAQLYADEFSLVNYRGTRLDKPRVLAALRTGALRFDSLAVSELRARVYGSAGVVTGLQHQVAREPSTGDGPHPSDVRFIHVYARRDGRWVLVATQITPVLRGP